MPDSPSGALECSTTTKGARVEGSWALDGKLVLYTQIETVADGVLTTLRCKLPAIDLVASIFPATSFFSCVAS